MGLITIETKTNVFVTLTPEKSSMSGISFLYREYGTRSITDYFPFGMEMPNRNWNDGGYRFGFNSHEKDNEVKGNGNWLSFGDYGFDCRIGRRICPDPQGQKGPNFSPYSTFFNNPNLNTDQNGEWPLFSHYRMTKRALIERGVDKKIAKKIAYYSATYADGAGKGVIFVNQLFGLFVGVNPRSIAKRSTDDNRYDNSQADDDPKMATVHAMRAYDENISTDEAVKRATDVANKVFEDISDVDINSITDETLLADIGVAFHIREDVSAHEGKRWVDKNKKNTKNKNEHGFGLMFRETFTMSRKKARLDSKDAASKLKVGSDETFKLPDQDIILGSENKK